MALRRARKRKKASITSLIDVIFLLLLFFMLASTFSRFSEVELAAADAGSAASSSSQTVYRLVVATNTVSIDEEQFFDEAWIGRLEARVAVDNGLILISVTPEATTQRLVTVLTSLSEVSGATVRVVVEP